MENSYNRFNANKTQTSVNGQGSLPANPYVHRLGQNRYCRIQSEDGINNHRDYVPQPQPSEFRGKRAFTLTYHQNTNHLPHLIENMKERTCKKGKSLWTPEEDTVLRTMIVNRTNINWKKVAFALPNRNSKQCRERWRNHVDPKINTSSLTENEKNQVLSLQRKIGNKWSAIAAKLKNRTENMVKNFYYLHKRRMKKKYTPKANEVRNYVEDALENSFLKIPKLHVDSFQNESFSDIEMPNHELYSSGNDFKYVEKSPKFEDTGTNNNKDSSNLLCAEAVNEISDNCTLNSKQEQDKELFNTRFETKRLIKKMFDSEL